MGTPGRHTRQSEVPLDSHVDAYRVSVGQFIARVMEQGAYLKNLANCEAIPRFDADDAASKRVDTFSPGDRVRLTASALNSMLGGERVNAALATKTWTVVECRCDLCVLGNVVAVDETVPDVGWRHFGRKALRHSGQPYVDELPAWVTDADTAAIQRGLRDGFRRGG